MSFADKIAEKALRELFLYWLQRKGSAALPRKRDLRPEEMPRAALPGMFMFEREGDRRLRCRLSGTAITAFYGFEATGKYLDELAPPEVLANRTEIFLRVLATGLPAYYEGRVVTEGRDHWRTARLLLPVASDGRIADTLLGAVSYRAASEGAMIDKPGRTPSEIVKLVEATDGDLVAEVP